MASKVEICNLALGHVGAYRIQSITEATKEARECNAVYDIALIATLEGHDWGFARKRESLALLTDTYTGWDYAYQYPTDCAAPRMLLDENGTLTGTSWDFNLDKYKAVGRVKYEVAVNDALNSRIILTDQQDAELLYTAKVTDTNLFSFQFIEALSLKLAVYLAQPLKGDINLKSQVMQMYNVFMLDAQGNNANEDYNKEEDYNSFVQARR